MYVYVVCMYMCAFTIIIFPDARPSDVGDDVTERALRNFEGRDETTEETLQFRNIENVQNETTEQTLLPRSFENVDEVTCVLDSPVCEMVVGQWTKKWPRAFCDREIKMMRSYFAPVLRRNMNNVLPSRATIIGLYRSLRKIRDELSTY